MKNPECHDCYEPATINHTTAFGEKVPLCDSCLSDRENGPNDDQLDYFPVTLDELHRRAFEQKYYGKGL
jgi:hypothetical protein